MKKHILLRVLHILNHMDYGGIEAVVMNYYRHMDRSKIQFDFAVSEDSVLPQKEEIENLGGVIYLLPGISNLSRYIIALKKVLKEYNYGIVHCHMNTLNVFPLFASFLAGVPVRICHNHTTAYKGEGTKTVVKYILRPFCKCFATEYFACGSYAGRWMYGNQFFEEGRVYVLYNAVELERFRFHVKRRKQIREHLGLNSKFVLGHIGRFKYQKNHNFLIDIFYEVYKKNKNAVLLLVGNGGGEMQIREKVNRLGLQNVVIFYGNSLDTSELYHAMDVFCLPSYYEGFPVVAVEAQVNGLPVFVSDEVTPEAKILDDYEMISLKVDSKVWAEKVLQVWKDPQKRSTEYLVMDKAGFSIEREALRLQHFYQKWGRQEY